MGVKPKYILVTWIQIPGFDEMNWKMVAKVPTNNLASNLIGSSASLLWGVPVNVKPCKIRDVKERVVS